MTTAKIEVRREKVKELMLRGLDYKAIKSELNMGWNSIVTDVKAIRKDLMKEVRNEALDNTVSKYIHVTDEMIKEIMADTEMTPLQSKNWVKNLLKERIEILQSLGLLPFKPSISVSEVTNYAFQWIKTSDNSVPASEVAEPVS